MLRALLVDRFKMAVHYEDRPVDVYTLVAAKPKFRKADPSNRTGCTNGPPQAPSACRYPQRRHPLEVITFSIPAFGAESRLTQRSGSSTQPPAARSDSPWERRRIGLRAEGNVRDAFLFLTG
jgi:uncharacterized protein (TIGR03435 family)